MDFELHHTEEQEEFRKEVRAWFDANTPPFERPEDLDDVTYEQWQVSMEFRRKLGKKGWLAPTYPKEYGGGGLSLALATVIAEEIEERHDTLPVYGWGDHSIRFALTVMKWGTEEQKRRLLRLMIGGEIITWEGFTEPEAGSDLAALRTRAVRDGDEYVINGEKIWIGNRFEADYIFTLVITDPTQPRHRNLGCFMIPAKQPGITPNEIDVFTYNPGAHAGKRHVFFEDVRVPASNLIGGETDGWQIAQEFLHGGGQEGGVFLPPRDRLFNRVVAYCQETQRHGQLLSQDPDVREAMVEIYIQDEIGRLFNLRNRGLRQARKRSVGYESDQSSLHGHFGKVSLPKIGAAYLRILGPVALIKEPKWAPLKGALEIHQRLSLVTHPGGAAGIHKLLMARQMGISRTRITVPAGERG